MGDDGTFTMYIDAVEQTYAKSSISERHPVEDLTVEEMFRNVRTNSY